MINNCGNLKDLLDQIRYPLLVSDSTMHRPLGGSSRKVSLIFSIIISSCQTFYWSARNCIAYARCLSSEGSIGIRLEAKLSGPPHQSKCGRLEPTFIYDVDIYEPQ